MWFKYVSTLYKTNVWGRKTFDSLPKSVKCDTQREHKVLSRSNTKVLDEAELGGAYLVCGGAQTYHSFWDNISVWYVTKIKGSYPCDTFFDVDRLDKEFYVSKEATVNRITVQRYERRI